MAIEGFEFVPWSEHTEIAEVQGFDIGIMPLVDAPFQRGKSGYKLIQHMACGLPTVASPVGVNCDIVDEGRSGFLVDGEQGWDNALRRLLGHRGLRATMGAAGREIAIAEYSLQSQATRLIALFRSLAGTVR